MGNPTIDDQNPGRRQVQKFSVAKGLDGNKGDQESKPYSFLMLKNCLVDKRQNAVLKRPGSTTETISSGLGVPLGASEYIEGSTGVMPVKRTVLANFAGNFRKQVSGEWSTVGVAVQCSFATSNQTQFAQLGNTMLVAGGLPAKWRGPTKFLERMGIVPPASNAPITIASVIFGSGITLVTGSYYMYTYYDSTTGLESDWSPLSAITGAVSNKSIAIGIPAVATQNFDSIKIYRTLDGGTIPYLVTTVAAGTTSYTDSKPDSQLTTRASDRYDKAIPPTSAFICAAYAQCFWMRDPIDPYKLVFSKPYTGDPNDLEYYPVDNFIMADEPITGLYAAPNKLLILHARGISYISGYSVDDFEVATFLPGVGTLFPNSISTNGTDFVFLAEQGFVTVPSTGGSAKHISREIDLDLQPILAGSYNASLYVSSAWNPSLRQFIFMVQAQSQAGSPWEEVGTGSTATAVAGWEIPTVLTIDTWEDVANPSAVAVQRVKFWGWSPELSEGIDNMWMEYTFADLADSNSSGAFPVYIFHPKPSSDTADPQQDKTYLGYFDGTEGKVKTLFRRDKNQDDSTTIVSELITGRIVPGADTGGFKLFQGIGFANSYSDPTSDSLATLKYLIDFDDPHLRSYTGSLVTISEAEDLKKFPTMLGRHIHLYLTDSSQSQTKILLGEFFIHWRERMRREGR